MDSKTDFDVLFDKMMAESGGHARRIAARFCYGRLDDIEDLLQEAKIRMYGAYCKNPANVNWRYYHRLLQNLGVDRWRHQERHREYLSPDMDLVFRACDSYEAIDQAVIDYEVNELLSHISNKRWRQTVVARYIEGLSIEEAAKRFGCAIGTIKSQSSRALEEIRRKVAPNG